MAIMDFQMEKQQAGVPAGSRLKALILGQNMGMPDAQRMAAAQQLASLQGAGQFNMGKWQQERIETPQEAFERELTPALHRLIAAIKHERNE